MDASQVARNLWVGSAPDPYDPDLGCFDVLVFAAKENQPSDVPAFTGHVILCGIGDEPRPPNEVERRKILAAARRVADSLYRGLRVFVSCLSGWNRSGLVAALALKMCTAQSDEEIIALVRAARGPHALGNEWFVEFLRRQNGY